LIRSGLATAKRFLAEGAHVLIVDLHATKAATDPELTDFVTKEVVAFHDADVTKEEDVVAYSARALTLFGRVDTIILCAGVCQKLADWKDVSEEIFDSQFAVNARGGTLTSYLICVKVVDQA
jgi:NAD(P)-dependent dehydrogenase (short-subunit alcohol dehydrogenase family)